jgi:hypothetical protein
MGLYKDIPPKMHLHTSLTLYHFDSLMHYPLQHASLRAPRMEPASILPLSTASKDDHLFATNHV